ncbi:MAG: cytidylate kinase family protein [Collinsella sp.]
MMSVWPWRTWRFCPTATMRVRTRMLFQKTARRILDLGETESCIIEGRLSDYLLRNNPSHIAVLVTAPFEDRVEIVRKSWS